MGSTHLPEPRRENAPAHISGGEGLPAARNEPVALAALTCYDVASASVAQLDRASVFGTEGWGFESLRAYSGFGGLLSSPYSAFLASSNQSPETGPRCRIWKAKWGFSAKFAFRFASGLAVLVYRFQGCSLPSDLCPLAISPVMIETTLPLSS